MDLMPAFCQPLWKKIMFACAALEVLSSRYSDDVVGNRYHHGNYLALMARNRHFLSCQYLAV
jgi:hypothetical protein